MELMRSGITLSGTYTITPLGMKTIDVYCDMVTDGGGWTVSKNSIKNNCYFLLTLDFILLTLVSKSKGFFVVPTPPLTRPTTPGIGTHDLLTISQHMGHSKRDNL